MARSGRPQDLRGYIDERLDELERQIKDLQRPTGTQTERKSYVASGNFNTSLSLASAPALTSELGPTLTFTLLTRRRVSISASTNYRYSKTSGGASSGTATLVAVLAGVSYYGDVYFGSSATAMAMGGSIGSWGSRVLDPGTYTASISCQLFVGEAVSSPGGTVSFADEYLLTVQVHEGVDE